MRDLNPPDLSGYAELARIAAKAQETYNLQDNKRILSNLVTEKIRSYMESHLGCTTKDVANGLDLPRHICLYHMRKLRKEWRGKR